MLAPCNPDWDTINKCYCCTNIAMEETTRCNLLCNFSFGNPRGFQGRWQVNGNCLLSKCSERRATAILTCWQVMAS